ncbi:hypothetical protein [Metabacillus sp. FJAT-52054]|uniref:Uncharacterized protein n=1 Tax=Metabacillus sediminis TaxID=3117746 RepID=A0ABZ2NH29_9BACI
MRNGIRALYNDLEFEVIIHDQMKFELFTKDPSAASLGFVIDSTGHYCKNVRRDDITSIYRGRYIAIYKGLEFPIFKEENNKILLGSGTAGPNIIEKYGFIQVERFEYENWVEKNEIEKIIEIKKPMWGFSSP